MKLVDANVLLYAVNPSTQHHRDSSAWLDRSLSGGAPVGFAWLALTAFIRISTQHRWFANPLTVDQATTQVHDWLGARSARILHPTERHAALLADLLAQVGSGGNLTNDAHLAALAIEHRATVITFDTDFDRFPGIRTERPR